MDIIKVAENKTITTEQILQDIEDTEQEIVRLEEDADYLEITPRSSAMYKMNNYVASGKRGQAEERQKFCQELREVLRIRSETSEQT